MHTHFKFLLRFILVTLLLSGTISAGELPKAVESQPCLSPPTIDGVIGDDEWKEAARFDFDLRMQQLNPATSEDRASIFRDDRRVIAAGAHVDKHVTTPGQDADDARQDARGGVLYDGGTYSFGNYSRRCTKNCRTPGRCSIRSNGKRLSPKRNKLRQGVGSLWRERLSIRYNY